MVSFPLYSKYTTSAMNGRWFGAVHASVAKFRRPAYFCGKG